ncbi:hypothetical protein [Amycolatopsis pittospori]|uniref:hypothetical protein n=1 Tax=Amycolatopsis pittospori TaxID=2749434 RepID=UPI002E2CA2A4|nr:hypothetical protein [Amycolatopsis pittospori]
MWSDAELDEALADLHSEPEVRQDELARAKASLLRAAGEVDDELLPFTAPPVKKRAGSWRWIAAAAAAALVPGGVIVATNVFVDNDGQDTAAHATAVPGDDALNQLRGDSFPLLDGQYRLVTESTWKTHTSPNGLIYQAREVLERWRTPNTWVASRTRFTRTGEIRWIKGDYLTAQRLGEVLPSAMTQLGWEGVPSPPTAAGPPTTTTSAPSSPRWGSTTTAVGPPVSTHQPLPEDSGWTNPSVEFLADLPTDPTKLGERLRHDGIWPGSRPPGSENSPPEMFEMAYNVMRSAQGFGDLRVALCKVLAKLPGITMNTGDATPDGRPAISFTIVLPDRTRTFVVDRGNAAVVRNLAAWSANNKEWSGLSQFDTTITVQVTDRDGP